MLAASGTKGLPERVNFKKTTNACDDEQARMPEESEIQTEEATTLKPREAKFVCTDPSS